MLTEKYRPKDFDEVVGQKEVIEALSSVITKNKDISHLLFYSQKPGTGKTSVAIIIGKKLLQDNFKNCFMELNASDERGIDTIRNKVKEFAKTGTFGEKFKIIFLDEADALTSDAQGALRRIMEQYYSNCRFIIACNYLHKIIDPIKSRCDIYEFNDISNDDLRRRLKEIADKENINLTEDNLRKLIEYSKGDMRAAINKLQTIQLTGTFNDIRASKQYLDIIKKFRYREACKIAKNFSQDSLYEISDIIFDDKEINEEAVRKLLIILANYDYRLSLSIDKNLQLYAMTGELIETLYNKSESPINENKSKIKKKRGALF